MRDRGGRSGLVALFLLAVLGGCQQYANSTPATVLESDDAANYQRIFREAVPPGVDVVHSVVVTYGFRIGIVTTDDWAFEIVAPRSWVERQKEKLRLGPAAGSIGAVEARKAEPIRPWYAPRSLSNYDAFVITTTSVPYVHLLSERSAQSDGRVRVFVSKH
ncbi:MAG: hypothetical protein NXI30_00770 [bacterium]|nr:hypothetical protein [bacterium]